MSGERLEEHSYGEMPDATPVQQFVLRNNNGMTVKLINYGATITEISVPDKVGNHTNVILGSDTLADYLKRFPSASVIGRHAGRIKDAKFSIDGKEYSVTKNAGPNHLHGGRRNFSKIVWEAKPLPVKKDQVSVQFSYVSVDGEEGFPGELTTTVTYTLTGKNELQIHYKARTDKPTIVNLTNHAYFNLSGDGDYSKHELRINSESYVVAGDRMIPTGKLAPVEGTPMDFRNYSPIGSRAAELTEPTKGYYDHTFVINGSGKELVLAARVRDPYSGRVMEVHTDQPGVQLFTRNKLGYCLETQNFPDSINHPHFPSPIVRPGIAFKSTTVYKFLVE
ncbi:MAG: aldose epimerase family protein [Puniceicoccaceae bacterium]